MASSPRTNRTHGPAGVEADGRRPVAGADWSAVAGDPLVGPRLQAQLPSYHQ